MQKIKFFVSSVMFLFFVWKNTGILKTFLLQLNSVFVSLISGKEIRSLPGVLRVSIKPVLCVNYPKCNRPICTHPHGQEELDIWMYMLKKNSKCVSFIQVYSSSCPASFYHWMWRWCLFVCGYYCGGVLVCALT